MGRDKEKLVAIISIITTSFFLIAVIFICVSSYYTLHDEKNSKKLTLLEKPSLMVKVEAQGELQQETTEKEGVFDKLLDRNGKKTILVLGVDAREDELEGRSDAMLVLTLDKGNDRMDMLSIPRDSYVEIVGKGKKDKITHAYAFGGLKMATDTVENMLDIKFDHSVVVNFTSFTGIIDALGGVEVEVPFDFSEQNSSGKHNAISFKEGYQTLDGEAALAYSRMRKKDPEGDVGRGKRQQQVIDATMQALRDPKNITSYASIFNTVRKSINTDVGITDLPNLTSYLRDYSIKTNHTLEGEGIKRQGIYYFDVTEDSLNDAKSVFSNTITFD